MRSTSAIVFRCAGLSAPALLLLAPSLALALRASLRLLRPHPAAFIFACPKKRRQKKGPPTTCPLLRKGFPALLAVSGARELPPFGRSDRHALVSGNGCDARRRQRDRGAHSQLRSAPSPWCSRAPQVKTGRSEDCLSDRRSRVPQRRFWPRSAGESEQSGDQALGGLFFGLPFFGQAKKGNAGALRRALSKTIRASAHKNTTHQARTETS